MNPIITVATQAVEALLPFGASMTSGGLQKVILFLEQIVPEIANAAPGVVTSVENIILAVRSHSSATPEQIAQTEAQAEAMEAALDAQAAKDGLV